MKLITNYNIGDVIKFEDVKSGLIYFGEIISLEVYCYLNKIGVGYVVKKTFIGPNCEDEEKLDKNSQIVIFDPEESEYTQETGYKFEDCYSLCSNIVRTGEPMECNNNSERR